MSLAFDLEQKIAWDELAPSLQAKFTDLYDKLKALQKEIDTSRGASFKSWAIRMWENSNVFNDLSFYEFYDVVQSGANNRISAKDKMNIWGNMTGPYYKDGHPMWVKHMQTWTDPATGEDKIILGCGHNGSASIWISDADGIEFTKVFSYSGSVSIWDIAVFKGDIYCIGYNDYVIYKSTDGVTWSAVHSCSGGHGKTLTVFNNTLMWIGPGTTQYTTDGINWVSQSNNCPSYVYSRYYKGNYIYVGTANAYPGVYRSSDGFNFTAIWNGTSADAYMRWICAWTPKNSGNTEYIVWGTGGSGIEAGTAKLMCYNTSTGEVSCLFNFRGDTGSNSSGALNYGHAPLEPLIATELNSTTSTDATAGTTTTKTNDANTGRTTISTTTKKGAVDTVSTSTVDPTSGYTFKRDVDNTANTTVLALISSTFNVTRNIDNTTHYNYFKITDSESGTTTTIQIDTANKTLNVVANGTSSNASVTVSTKFDATDKITTKIIQNSSSIVSDLSFASGDIDVRVDPTADGTITSSTASNGTVTYTIKDSKNSVNTTFSKTTSKYGNISASDGSNLSIAISTDPSTLSETIALTYSLTETSYIINMNVSLSGFSFSINDPETSGAVSASYVVSSGTITSVISPDIELSPTSGVTYKLSGFRERQIRYIEVFENDYTGESFLIIGTSDCHFYRELNSSKLVYSSHDWSTHTDSPLIDEYTNTMVEWDSEDKSAWATDDVADSGDASAPTYMGNVYAVSPKYPNDTFSLSKLVVTLIKHTEDNRVYSMCTFTDPNGVKWAYAGTGGGNYDGRGLLYRFGYSDLLNLIEAAKLGAILPPKWSVEGKVNQRLLQKASRFYLKVMGGVSGRDCYSEIRFAFTAHPIASTSIEPYIKLIFNHAGTDNYYAAKFYPVGSSPRIEVIDVTNAVETIIETVSVDSISVYTSTETEEAIDSPMMGPFYILSALVYPGEENPESTTSSDTYLYDSLDGKIEVYLRLSTNRLDTVGSEDVISKFTINYSGGERKHIGQYGFEMFDLPSFEILTMKQMSYNKYKQDALEVGEIDFAVR